MGKNPWNWHLFHFTSFFFFFGLDFFEDYYFWQLCIRLTYLFFRIGLLEDYFLHKIFHLHEYRKISSIWSFCSKGLISKKKGWKNFSKNISKKKNFLKQNICTVLVMIYGEETHFSIKFESGIKRGKIYIIWLTFWKSLFVTWFTVVFFYFNSTLGYNFSMKWWTFSCTSIACIWL